MCLFSNKLTTTHKEDIATEIVILQPQFTDSSKPSNLEKPIFPEKPKKLKKVEPLVKFLKPFFQAIQCKGEFHYKPVQEWSEDVECKRAKDLVRNIIVVNDGAERAIMLSLDFHNSSKNEKNTYRSNLQLVEYKRKERCDLRYKNN